MTDRLDPTEEYDGRPTVKLLDDHAETKEVPFSSYADAISYVRKHQHEVAAAKIVDRDGDVVFSSAEMDIDTWESVWKSEKRRLSVDVEERECPYDNVSCFADDLCVQCQMDELQRRS